RSRRRCRGRAFAPAAAKARTEADARLRAEFYGAGSPVARRAPGLFCPRQRGGFGPLTAELLPRANKKRTFIALLRPRPVFRRLARTAGAPPRQPRVPAGDDGRAGGD